jgi:hypothetical protein
MGKAPTYLSMVGQAENDKCWWWCGSGASQTREHCSRWKDQRVTMWRDIGKATRSDDPEHRYGTALRRRKMHSGYLGVPSTNGRGHDGAATGRALLGGPGRRDLEEDQDDGETEYGDGMGELAWSLRQA